MDEQIQKLSDELKTVRREYVKKLIEITAPVTAAERRLTEAAKELIPEGCYQANWKDEWTCDNKENPTGKCIYKAEDPEARWYDVCIYCGDPNDERK